MYSSWIPIFIQTVKSFGRQSGFFASLATLALSVGCSKTPKTEDPEAIALAALITDYKLQYNEKDDQGRVIDLRLEGRDFDDEAIDHACKFKMLQGLSLASSSVSDAGMKKLQDLTRLHRITLVGTAVTDRGMADLENVPSLHYVWLNQTDKLTAKGIESLKNAVPGINVYVMNQPAGD